MVRHALMAGRLGSGKILLDATSGNTGIAFAMLGASFGFPVRLVMPSNVSPERKRILKAYGAEVEWTDPDQSSDGAIRRAREIAANEPEKYCYMDQYSNPANWRAHYETTGPEIWRDTDGRITHFVSSMGTTGTIMGCSRFFKEKNPKIQVIGCEPKEGSQIPGIRKWPQAYLPKIYDKARVDRIEPVSQAQAEDMTRRMAREEGIFAGISSGGAMHVALRVARELKNAVVVTIVCDRGDRYLTTGVFPD